VIGKPLIYVFTAFVLSAQTGCAEVAKKMQPSWHEKFNWNAEDYFDNPQVIALCRAIEGNDLAEIDRLVDAGVDVNRKGNGNMTLLLWAFPDNKLERFKRLLEHGADPNVVIESDFNTRGGMSAGDSVTHLACQTAFPGYFDAVFAHGGDPNLKRDSIVGMHDTPLFTVITSAGANKKQKIQLLINVGADLNYVNGAGMTPTMQAVSWGGQYEIALALLEAGADHRVYQTNEVQRLVHVVVRQERRLPEYTPQQSEGYQKLVRWLEDHGESIDEAKADIRRWDSWSRTSGEYRRKMDAEIAARKAREAHENENEAAKKGSAKE
jgi:hypothetical protein